MQQQPRRVDLRWLDDPRAAAFDAVVLNTPMTPLGRRLAAAAHTLVCADGGANRLFDTAPEILPAFVVGDLDSLRADVRAAYLSKGVRIERVAEQDSNDLEKAIKQLRAEAGPTPDRTIVVIGGLCRRIDHTFCNLHVLLKDRLARMDVVPSSDIFIVDEGSICCVITATPEEGVVLELPKLAHEGCGILPLEQEAVVSSRGLKWELDGHVLAFGRCISSSNQPLGEEVWLKTSRAICWTTSLSA